MEAYVFAKDMTEREIIAELFKLYEKLTEKSVRESVLSRAVQRRGGPHRQRPPASDTDGSKARLRHDEKEGSVTPSRRVGSLG